MSELRGCSAHPSFVVDSGNVMGVNMQVAMMGLTNSSALEGDGVHVSTNCNFLRLGEHGYGVCALALLGQNGIHVDPSQVPCLRAQMQAEQSE